MLIVVGLLVVLGLVASIPPIRERLAYRLDEVRVRVRYALFPPEKVVFVPKQEASAPANTRTPTLPATATATLLAAATSTPAPTSTPLPGKVSLTGVKYEDQHGLWNYCAPTNLAMALSYWGWQGTRLDTGAWLKPFQEDKNVMPYELLDYVQSQTGFKGVLRDGGTLNLVRSLIAGGFPVVIEKGVFIRETTTGKNSWMGHYNLVTGFDDSNGNIIVQDSYYTPNYKITYADFVNQWRGFNYTFLVIYPPEKEADVLHILGDYADDASAEQIAAKKASEEIFSQTDTDQFLAWFNRGTSLQRLQDYAGAADAYDQAFKLYATLPEATRPYRIMWYQTGPYYAYYFMARYQDVVDLATTTLSHVDKPYLEESFFWRARAENALGDTKSAVDDLRTALKYHPNWQPALDQLANLGEKP